MTEPLTAHDLDLLKHTLSKATSGEWQQDGGRVFDAEFEGELGEFNFREDAEFAAVARNVVPKLIAAYEATGAKP